MYIKNNKFDRNEALDLDLSIIKISVGSEEGKRDHFELTLWYKNIKNKENTEEIKL